VRGQDGGAPERNVEEPELEPLIPRRYAPHALAPARLQPAHSKCRLQQFRMVGATSQPQLTQLPLLPCP